MGIDTLSTWYFEEQIGRVCIDRPLKTISEAEAAEQSRVILGG